MNLGDLPIWFMQFGPFAGDFSFQNLIYQWEAVGVFDFLLPLLLIFAIIFAILSQTRVLGDHKGVNIMISLILGLFATRVPFVSNFFGVLFANLGIAIAGLVVLLILTGLFYTEKNSKAFTKTFYAIALIAGTIVIVATLNQFYWFGSFWWQQNWIAILWIGIAVIVIGGLIFPDKDKAAWGNLEPIRKSLFGNN